MAGSLKQLMTHVRASAGGAVNDHDPIARVRPVDAYAVATEIKRLRNLAYSATVAYHAAVHSGLFGECQEPFCVKARALNLG